jgi:hypothetical protein
MLLFIGLKLLTIVPNYNLIVTAANSFIGISSEAFLIGTVANKVIISSSPKLE